MISIDYDTAVSMVKQLYPAARDPMLNVELELTRGLLRYRPYAVYFKFLITEYRKIIKADEVTFAYSDNLRGILERQRELDAGDTIPESQTVDNLLSQICVNCETSPASGIGLIIV